ncbi:uncharacterized protein OCT59_013204 [Rhizophagus irregularis]|uniref:HMG box domain-containing protein n=2 Tax=Rhizophagus irregularis TaxID=588596 RepID=A0A015K3C7_RHIIW|nr:hypothetical protein RirG_034570 [Rhizophagus irregularis DAOM 197198w]UZO20788.1 hypothetical protein OCT59_013204 [Rhizophagus irregularis]GBC27737.2 mating type protein MAT1-1-3 [Rhizophagus irregularis DAOM 181602=DAOM 197198]CAG8438290.1 2054_t:CDS:1 [Rhizophagus irregularis]
MSNKYYQSINNPITFSTDEVLVRNYRKFNLTYEELINNSQNTRLAKRNKKNGTNIIPRRQNAWILYLRDKSRKMKGFSSKEIAKMWNDEPKEVVEVYEAAARLAAERHMEKYGLDYKYLPRRTRNKKPKISKTSRIPITPPTTPPSKNSIQFPIVTPPEFQILEFVPAPSEPDNINDVQFPDNLLQLCDIMQLMQNCEECRSLLQGLPNINFENPSDPLESQHNEISQKWAKNIL